MTDTNDGAARLAGIRERAEAAAPGPWWFKWEHGETRDGEFFGFVHFTEFLEGESESWVRIQGEDYRENADFIARSREDIPYLLAELDAAKAENEKLQKEIGQHQSKLNTIQEEKRTEEIGHIEGQLARQQSDEGYP